MKRLGERSLVITLVLTLAFILLWNRGHQWYQARLIRDQRASVSTDLFMLRDILPGAADQRTFLIDGLGAMDSYIIGVRDTEGNIIYGNINVFTRDPVLVQVYLPGATWQIGAIPIGGWQANARPQVMIFDTLILLAGLLIIGSIYIALSNQTNLQRNIHSSYEEISELNRQLRTDITEKKKVETALRESEANLAKILYLAGDAIITIDQNQSIVLSNKAAETIFGYSSDELLGMPISRIIPARFVNEHTNIFENPDRQATIILTADDRKAMIGLRKDGQEFPVEASISRVSQSQGAEFIVVMRDVTERLRMETALREREQQLEERVAERTRQLSTLIDVSHSINSTLDLQLLLGMVLDKLKEVVDYTAASVLTITGDKLQIQAARNPFVEEIFPRISFSVDSPLDRLVIQGLKPVVIGDITADEPVAAIFRETAGEHMQLFSQFIRSWMGVPLIVKGRAIGMLALDHIEPGRYTAALASLVMTFANQASVAIENARLYEEAQKLAAGQERQRLARELHDSVSQALYGISLGAHTAQSIIKTDPIPRESLEETLDYTLNLAKAGLAEMRALIFELRPESLEKEGLIAALSKHAAAMEARYQLTVVSSLDAEPELPLDAKETLYRIAQEALHNVVKHAQAHQVVIRLECQQGNVVLEVQDDGIGFNPHDGFPGHLGLQSMRERIQRINGTVDINSTPGHGTCVRAQVPA